MLAFAAVSPAVFHVKHQLRRVPEELATSFNREMFHVKQCASVHRNGSDRHDQATVGRYAASALVRLMPPHTHNPMRQRLPSPPGTAKSCQPVAHELWTRYRELGATDSHLTGNVPRET